MTETKQKILDQNSLALLDNVYVSLSKPKNIPGWIQPNAIAATQNWQKTAKQRFLQMSVPADQVAALLEISNNTDFIEKANNEIAETVENMINNHFSGSDFKALTQMSSKKFAQSTTTVEQFIQNYINPAIDIINKIGQDTSALIMFQSAIQGKHYNANKWLASLTSSQIQTVISQENASAAKSIIQDLINVLKKASSSGDILNIEGLVSRMAQQGAGVLNEELYNIDSWAENVATSLVTGGLRSSSGGQIKTDIRIKGLSGRSPGMKYNWNWNVNLNIKETATPKFSSKTGLPNASLKLLSSTFNQLLFKYYDNNGKEALANTIAHYYPDNKMNIKKAILLYNLDKAFMGHGEKIDDFFDASTIFAVTTSKGVKVMSTLNILNIAINRIVKSSGQDVYGYGLTVSIPASAPANNLIQDGETNNELQEAVQRSNNTYKAILGMQIEMKFNPAIFFDHTMSYM